MTTFELGPLEAGKRYRLRSDAEFYWRLGKPGAVVSRGSGSNRMRAGGGSVLKPSESGLVVAVMQIVDDVDVVLEPLGDDE